MSEPTNELQDLQSREWRVRDALSAVQVPELDFKIGELRRETGLSPITLRVCLARGLETPEAIRAFLSPRLDSLTDPFLIQDMRLAVDRLSRARQESELVWIFGDYDVDGTTGAALLTWVFREFGFATQTRQPDRFKDGYGLNVGAVEEAAEAGAGVLVTVDCGITSFEAAERARELGLDLIVVDHHQLDPNRGLPAAMAVVNPQREDCPSGLRQLCGCGLAFSLSCALRSHGRAEGWWSSGQEPNLKQHLDLVVMATAADMVPLTGDNHTLVRHGLQVLKHSNKLGVRALLRSAGLELKDISPGHLGFVIGPRINASGRMGSASLALELLTTQNPARATELAQELERMNRERADLQNRIWDEVRARVEAGLSEGKYRNGILLADAGWHEGVVGIVASRVTETFKKPAAVVALRDGIGKGSVRSFGGKDVLAALRENASLMLGFGGHRHAAGLTVSADRVDELAEGFDRSLEHLAHDESALPLMLEGDCSLRDLDFQTFRELEQLGPFGPGNPEPIFSVKARVHRHRVLKERHLKLSLSSNQVVMDAIFFNAAERPIWQVHSDQLVSQELEWAAVPELNRFGGRVSPTLRVRDWRIPSLLSPCALTPP